MNTRSETLNARNPRGMGLSVRSRLQRGFTLLELIITLAIIAILSAGTIPIARNMIKRDKEMELRRNLRQIRKAIEMYKISCDGGKVPQLERNLDDECYPKNLQILVEGIKPPNQLEDIRFLRAIPKDPFTGKAEWGMRSVQDDTDSTSWGGQNVFDVFSLAPGTALNGSKYSDW